MPLVETFRTISRNLRAPAHRRQAFHRLEHLHADRPSLDDLVRQAIKLGTHGWYRVRSLQIPSEILSLAQAVEAIKPRVILEIGTARGGTALIWAHLASHKLITCDLLDKRGFADLVRAFPPPGSTCKVEVLIGDSHAPDFIQRVKNALRGELVDFLFIDGDHTEAGVGQDFENYRGLVRPGGLIAFHDIAEKQPLATNQVQHFWKRIRGQHDVREFVADRGQCGFGIGVIRTPLQNAAGA
ncbi:MAG: class I SAM-dependent methyltransferase [Nitrospirota bacterium]|nr:class I SAM-dependent methyltransferase [Nitrospirota bacterium]